VLQSHVYCSGEMAGSTDLQISEGGSQRLSEREGNPDEPAFRYTNGDTPGKRPDLSKGWFGSNPAHRHPELLWYYYHTARLVSHLSCI
jgi:hypothetical protein